MKLFYTYILTSGGTLCYSLRVVFILIYKIKKNATVPSSCQKLEIECRENIPRLLILGFTKFTDQKFMRNATPSSSINILNIL